MASLSQHSWRIRIDPAMSGQQQMRIDHEALFSQVLPSPTLRFFKWNQKTVSYGYLLDVKRVEAWVAEEAPGEKLPMVQRPTGGGAVIHEISDLSLSLLWPRGEAIFPEKPRDCYEAIHTKILQAFIKHALIDSRALLYQKPTGQCQTEALPAKEHFSACFEQPVCHDVMVDGKKVIGGALRFTKTAVLYQGTIQLASHQTQAALISALQNSFSANRPI